MPIYEYKCDNGHVFEVIQRMTDDPVQKCETCKAPVQRVFHPIAVHFKGSGFYNTDYGTRKRSKEMKESAESGAAKTEAKAKDKKESGSSSSSSSSDSKGSGASTDTGKSSTAKKKSD